jgi:hypothetical protein
VLDRAMVDWPMEEARPSGVNRRSSMATPMIVGGGGRC